MMIDFKEIEHWIKQAGKIALQNFQQEIDFQYKEDHSVVTRVDREIEEFLVDKIKRRYPDHQIISEEGTDTPGNVYSWVIDPLDGTRAYVWGVPTWCISIGILKDMRPEFGVVFVPSSNDVYSAKISSPAFLNERPLKKLTPRLIDQTSTLCISPRTLQEFDISFPGNIIALGSGIFQHSLVARGSVIASLTLQPNIWDLAGIFPIVNVLGGSAKYISGEDVNLEELYRGKSPEPIIVSHPDNFTEIRNSLFRRNVM